MIASRRVNMIRHPRGSYIIEPIHCYLWGGHTRTESNSLARSSTSKSVGTRRRSPPYERVSAGCSSLFMRLAEHLTALPWRLVQAISVWLVKIRRAPSRHSRDARVHISYVYGHVSIVVENTWKGLRDKKRYCLRRTLAGTRQGYRKWWKTLNF